jgi:hypothetical protein
MVSIDGTDISGATIDGQAVQEITVDGDVVWTANQVIDGFEDGDISEYSGYTSGSTAQIGTVKNGSYALEINDSGSKSVLHSTSGLNYYPSQGDAWRYWVQAGSGGNHCHMGFGYQSSGNSYDVDTMVGSGKIVLNVDGNSLASSSVSLSRVNWYEVKIDWGSDGEISADLYDSSGSYLTGISATDTTYTSGGIYWAANSFNGSNHYFDYARTV